MGSCTPIVRHDQSGRVCGDDVCLLKALDFNKPYVKTETNTRLTRHSGGGNRHGIRAAGGGLKAGVRYESAQSHQVIPRPAGGCGREPILQLPGPQFRPGLLFCNQAILAVA